MTEPQIKLNGYLDVPAERWASVLAALNIHIDLTRAEDGCIDFDVTPSQDIAHRLLVSEHFIDQASFDAHQSRTQASDWARASAGIARRYEITVVPT
jgi:quinol monooxygenase YgiN